MAEAIKCESIEIFKGFADSLAGMNSLLAGLILIDVT